jgi:hypothetical protein
MGDTDNKLIVSEWLFSFCRCISQLDVRRMGRFGLFLLNTPSDYCPLILSLKSPENLFVTVKTSSVDESFQKLPLGDPTLLNQRQLR